MYLNASDMIYNARQEMKKQKPLPKKSDFERESDFYKTCVDIAQFNEELIATYDAHKSMFVELNRNVKDAVDFNMKNQMPSHFNDKMKEIILNKVYDTPFAEKSFEIECLVDFYQDMLEASKRG